MIQREHPIREQTENRRADHVSHKKRITEQTGLGHARVHRQLRKKLREYQVRARLEFAGRCN